MWKVIQAVTTDLFSIPRYKTPEGKVNPGYDEESYLWRLKNVSILSVLMVVTIMHLAQVYGFGLGEGFASNDDVKDIQVTQIEERLDKYYKALCMRPGNEEILALIRELQAKYEKLMGQRYEPLSCDLLMTVEG